MSTLKYFSCIVLLALTSRIYSQDKSIFIFDPIQVSSSFQNSFSELSGDEIFVDNSINSKIFEYDALFLFIGYQYALNQTEGELLIDYLETRRPIYVFAKLWYQPTFEVSFWNFIGIEWYAELPLYVLVDSVIGTNTSFSSGVNIDTSFWSSQIPGAQGNINTLLKGIGSPMDIDVAYISGYDSINVLVDQFHQIYHTEFLKRVITQFGLNLRSTPIHFFPPVDTAWIFGGCTGPDLISHNLVSTPTIDSITIEPGPSSYFFYYDSLRTQIPVDKFYFIVEDSLNQYDYELWFHPKSWPPFDPVQIMFDSVFYFQQNLFDIQLLVKLNNNPIDSLSQLFRADWGLGVEENGEPPFDFSLSQNYPNPFNPSTNIEFRIADFGFVSLKIYDVLGNEIATLVNEEKQPGIYEVKFSIHSDEGRNLSSGKYFYQLKVRGPEINSGQGFIETKKMVLMK